MGLRYHVADSKGKEKWGQGREDPPAELNNEEACDERSVPPDVTSSEFNAKGSICSQRSTPQQTERPPTRLPKGDSRSLRLKAKENRQADGGRSVGFLEFVAHPAAAAELFRSAAEADSGDSI